MFDINDIKSQLAYGGARQNQFRVQIYNPANVSGNLKIPFMVTAASIPTMHIGTIPVYYFGRAMKLAGDRVFDNWTVTIINDEDFLIRNAMEDWSNQINRLRRNVRDLDNYKSTATVSQMAKDGVTVLREYEFHGIWPETISGIDLDWSNTDQIEYYQVSFAYDEYSVLAGNTGDGGGF